MASKSSSPAFIRTGKPYNWPLGNLTDIARDDLPEISAAEAQQLVDDIVDLLCRDFGYTRASARPARNKGNGTPQDYAGDWQALVDSIRAGNDLHASTRDLAAKMARSGMDGGAIVISARVDGQLGGPARSTLAGTL